MRRGTETTKRPAPWRGTSWGAPAETPTWGQRLGRWLLRRRRLVAALLLCAAAALTVQQLTPASSATAGVLVSGRDLPAGHTLQDGDLLPVGIPPSRVPAGSLADASWQGRQLAGPMRRGEVLTDAALLGEELLIGAPAGTQAVPLHLSDASTLPLIHQGQLVTVVLSTRAGMEESVATEVLARGVPVLWTPTLASADTSLLPAPGVDALVVVAADPEQAVRLAGASARGEVFLVLVP